MERFLSIKKFSEISGIEVSTLRYWDNIGLFSPIRRNKKNDYRQYSLAQLIPLNFITVLSDIDVTLKDIGELGNERNPQKFMTLIDRQEKQLNMAMNKLRISYSIIHARRELVSYGMTVDDKEISVMHREDKPIILGPRNDYTNGGFIDALASFVKASKKLRINLRLPVGEYHESMESFVNTPNQPEYFFSLDPTGYTQRKAGNYLVGFARGYYGKLGDLPERMASYAKEKSLTLSGPVYTMYLLDELCTQDPSQFLAQSCVAVSKKK